MLPQNFLEGTWRPDTNTRLQKGGDWLKRFSVNLNDRSIFRNEIEGDWWFWRPIVNKVITYSEACQIDQYEILLINAALDKKQKEDNKQWQK